MNFHPTINDIRSSYFGRTWFFSSWNDEVFCYSLIKGGKRHEIYFSAFDGIMLEHKMLTEELINVIFEVEDYNVFNLVNNN